MCRKLFLKSTDRKDVILAEIDSKKRIQIEKIKANGNLHSPSNINGGGKSHCSFKTNCIWIICILACSLIGAVTYILLNKIPLANLETFLSSASLIISLVLSLFAIMYTYTSNAQIESKFEKIDSAATRIDSVSNDISKTEFSLKENIDAILSKLSNVDNHLATLADSRIKDDSPLPPGLDNLPEKERPTDSDVAHPKPEED